TVLVGHSTRCASRGTRAHQRGSFTPILVRFGILCCGYGVFVLGSCSKFRRIVWQGFTILPRFEVTATSRWTVRRAHDQKLNTHEWIAVRTAVFRRMCGSAWPFPHLAWRFEIGKLL